MGCGDCSCCSSSCSGCGEELLSRADHTDHTQNGKNFARGSEFPMAGRTIRFPSFNKSFCPIFVRPILVCIRSVLISCEVRIASHTPMVAHARTFQMILRMTPITTKSRMPRIISTTSKTPANKSIMVPSGEKTCGFAIARDCYLLGYMGLWGLFSPLLGLLRWAFLWGVLLRIRAGLPIVLLLGGARSLPE